MFGFDLLFYGYIKKSYDRRWKGYFYVAKGFAFALFLNFVTIYLLLKEANIFTSDSDTDAWGFAVSGLLGAAITFMLDSRKHKIIDKFKKRNSQDLPLWWIGHFVFSSAAYIATALR